MSVIALFLWLGASIAFGQAEPAPQVGFLEQLGNLDFLGKILAFGAIVQLALYCTAEVLTRLSAWIDTKSPTKVWVSKFAAWASEAAWFLGSMLGKVGYSVPKLVMEEKAKEIMATPPKA